MKKMLKRIALGVAALATAIGLTFGAVAPAQAATYTYYSTCSTWGQKSGVRVELPSRSAIKVEAYNSSTGAYLGSKVASGIRIMSWGTNTANVRFRVVTGVNASVIRTYCHIQPSYVTYP